MSVERGLAMNMIGNLIKKILFSIVCFDIDLGLGLGLGRNYKTMGLPMALGKSL